MQLGFPGKAIECCKDINWWGNKVLRPSSGFYWEMKSTFFYIFTWNPSWQGEDEYEELHHVSSSVCVHRRAPNSGLTSVSLVMWPKSWLQMWQMLTVWVPVGNVETGRCTSAGYYAIIMQIIACVLTKRRKNPLEMTWSRKKSFRHRVESVRRVKRRSLRVEAASALHSTIISY